MSEETAKKSTGFKLPHVYVVILIIMLFISALTYIVPSGSYTRVTVPNAAAPVVDPASYAAAPRTPVGPMKFFTSIYDGFVGAAGIIGAVLLVSGAIQVLQSTGTFAAGIQKMLKVVKGREIVVVFIFFTIMTFMGVIGYLDGLYPFYPIIIAIFMSIGYDRMVGSAVIMLSTAVGFTSGLVNMYTTGISQQIVGLPMYSGIGYRAVGLCVFYVIASFFLFRYCSKIKKDPAQSLMGANYLSEQVAPIELDESLIFDGRRAATLALFVFVIAFSAFCAVNYKWGLAEITAMYFPLIIAAAIIFRISPDEACREFTKGMSAVMGPALVIGLARAASILLSSGNITDTIVKFVADLMSGRSALITLLIIYIFVTVFNFFIVSGSGKAVIMMPILSPLGQILGINQQVLVLAYQYGDGLTNTLWPTGALVQLSLCGMDYGRWFRFAWKPYACMMAAAYIMIVIADKINYGPF
jgi:uncharacterized ion transporter superfamily protein YfcC